jgi:pimeloyl-ACP methyl ester carboxylesterase
MKKFDTGTAELAYEAVGSERGLPLVFLHGSTLDHVSMKNTFEKYFAGRDLEYRRVYVDLPGHGASGHSLLRANMGALLEDLGAFLRGNFERPPCLVGYSLGGFAALKLAESIPFPSLFLIAPPVCTDKDRVTRPLAVKLAADELSEEEKADADARYLLLAAKRTTDTLKRYRANLGGGFSAGRWLYQARLVMGAAGENLSVDPALINSSTTFLVGRQDLLVGYRDQFELSMKLQSSEYHSFSDCGHFLPVECAQFGGLFRNWLHTATLRTAAAAPRRGF